MNLCYKKNGERAAFNYCVMDARGRLLSTQEAIVRLFHWMEVFIESPAYTRLNQQRENVYSKI